MDWIEVTARTVEEAKELALDRLGVVEDELEYELLEEPRAALFGLRRSDARIRARVKPLSREKPGERRQRRRRERRGGESPGRAARPREAADARTAGSEPSREGGGARPAGERSRRSRRRGGRGGRAAGAADREFPDETNHQTEAGEVDESTLPLEEQAAAAARFTETLVELFGLRAAVRAEVVDDDVDLRVDGDGVGVLVGPRGVTIQAVEELVRAVVQHAAGGRSARVHLDVGGYRERRRAALADFATKIAREVQASGVERVLEPMFAPDRKVVHDAVALVDGVTTTSEGEDPRRRVVIRPA
jgi:spoIIIJ-associated protein